MAGFIGKWKSDGSTYKNLEEYVKAGGMPPKMVDLYKSSQIEAELTRNGDTYTSMLKIGTAPAKVQTFKNGEEVESSYQGRKMKVTNTFVSDTKWEMVESYEVPGIKKLKTVRELVDKDTIIRTNILECGTQMTSEMKRVK